VFFTLRLPQSADREQIKIYDVTGKVVKELESSAKKELRISLDGIKNGVYFVRVGDETVKEKLIVTR
jgi:flagellar hook assembly protein FlgD